MTMTQLCTQPIGKDCRPSFILCKVSDPKEGLTPLLSSLYLFSLSPVRPFLIGLQNLRALNCYGRARTHAASVVLLQKCCCILHPTVARLHTVNEALMTCLIDALVNASWADNLATLLHFSVPVIVVVVVRCARIGLEDRA